MNIWKRIILLAWACGLWLAPAAVLAQTEPPATPPIPQVHIVQEGEVLVTIADQYGTTAEAIQILNNLTDPNAIYVGQELRLPGAVGEALPVIYTVRVGDTLADIAAKFNTTTADIAQRNALLNPEALWAGGNLALLSGTGTAEPQVVTGTAHIVHAGETLLTVAATYGLPTTAVAELNNLGYPARLYVGQRLRLPSTAEYRFLPSGWAQVQMRPSTIRQGDTVALYVVHTEQGQPTADLIDAAGQAHPVQFAPSGAGYVALIGLDAFAPTGRYTLTLSGQGVARPWWPWTQTFAVTSGDYGLQQITVAPELAPLLASEVRASEDEYLAQIFNIFTPAKQWQGTFTYPVPEAIITAGYGDSRSYNGGPVEIFHTGIDFAGSDGTPILAPAGGTVVFTGTLNLRGQTVIVDHGWGVMSAYYHLSEIKVKVGDVVQAGQQVLGLGGSTGLSTGPHLHWDVRVHNTAVNPLPWLTQNWP